MSNVITTAKIDELLSQVSTKLGNHVIAANTYRSINQPILNNAYSLRAEFRICSEALTNYVKLFAFGKKPSAQFSNDGNQGFFTNSSCDAPKGAKTDIGTIDYWAASIVDSTFMDLCRQRIRVRDEIRSHSPGSTLSNAAHLQTLMPGNDYPQIKHHFTDTARGWLSHDDFGNTQSPNRIFGAYLRLNEELANRFEFLMKDPKKAAIIRNLCTYFRDSLTDISTTKPIEQTGIIDRIIANDPMVGAMHYDQLRRLAYVKTLGFSELQVENDGVQQAINRCVTKAKYENGTNAPKYGQHDVPEYDIDLGFEAKVDAVLNDLNLPKLPQNMEGVAFSQQIVSDAMYPYTGGSIPQKPKMFLRGFIDGAQQIAKTAPTPAG